MKVGYAILYEDGELTISKDPILLQKKIDKDYWEFEDVNVPWENEATEIKTVRILDSVKSNCMRYWFKNFINLTTLIDFQNLNVSDCEDFSYMCFGCNQLKDIKSFYNWNVSNGIDFTGMFAYCTNLSDINSLQNWDVSNGTYFTQMFYYCTNLSDIDALQNWDVSNGMCFIGMFAYCTNLSDIRALQNLDVSNGTYFTQMFYYCTNLSDIDALQNWDVLNGIGFSGMFAYCENLIEIHLPSTLNQLEHGIFDHCNPNLKIHWKSHIYIYEDLFEYGNF